MSGIVVYAMGDGLGHLTRANAAIHTIGGLADLGPPTYITSSPFARDPRVRRDAAVEEPPAEPSERRDWLRDFLFERRPDVVMIDAFPAGIAGEVAISCIPPGAEVVHIARLLAWRRYETRLDAEPPRFDRTYAVEPLTADHSRAVAGMSRTVQPLNLTDPPDRYPAAGTTDPPDGDPGPRTWLVVHSGPAGEVGELVRYALDVARAEQAVAPITVACPRPVFDELVSGQAGMIPSTIHHLDRYPVALTAAGPARFVTAAGFNTMRQLSTVQDRHIFIPFPRSLDDQFTRARRARRRRAVSQPRR